MYLLVPSAATWLQFSYFLIKKHIYTLSSVRFVFIFNHRTFTSINNCEKTLFEYIPRILCIYRYLTKITQAHRTSGPNKAVLIESSTLYIVSLCELKFSRASECGRSDIWRTTKLWSQRRHRHPKSSPIISNFSIVADTLFDWCVLVSMCL